MNDRASSLNGADQKIPCFLINLDRSQDRLTSFKHQARSLGIQFTRIRAIDGDVLDEQTRFALLRTNIIVSNRSLTPRELGCLLSHRKVWEKILEERVAWSFVAEDDIFFDGSSSPLFFSTDWLPRTTQLVKADNADFKCRLSKKVFSDTECGYKLRQLRSLQNSSGGYFISEKGAASLLRVTSDCYAPVDLMIYDEYFGQLELLNIMQLVPAICTQSSTLTKLHSTIETERIESWKIINNISPSPYLTNDLCPTVFKFSPNKPKGFRKIKREIIRPFRQVYICLKKIYICLIIAFNNSFDYSDDLILKVPFRGRKNT